MIKPLGEDSILVEYEPKVSREVNSKTHQIAYGLEQAKIAGLIEAVPAYRSLIVYYDPFQLNFSDLVKSIENLSAKLKHIQTPPHRSFRIPAVYGGKFGPDIERISCHTGLEPNEIIHIFSNQILHVYCLGFTCSLAYLGGVSEALHTPRLTTPRSQVPAGSVGFAGPQANILPVDTPSGFNYVGRVFVSVYDPNRFPPTPIRPGDLIKCPAVSESEARAAGQKELEEFVDNFPDR